uniref:CDGSH iron-sulfur domain-containing protein 2A-like isoform X1 n=2 Tax=Myxine glutinosa TaxID=7769 RepID=UPI0035900089
MEYVSRLFRQQLPAYLKALPVPSSLVGFLTLSVAEWLRLLPFLGLMTLLGYLAFGPLFLRRSRVRDRPINLKIQKETAKVVNEIHVEDLREAKKCYCRCWRSKTEWLLFGHFPIKHRFVKCCRDCCPSGRFSHLSFLCVMDLIIATMRKLVIMLDHWS